MKTLKCSCGKDITLDDEDYFRVSFAKRYCYARSLHVDVIHETYGKQRIAMASFIMNLYHTMYDHKDRNYHNMCKDNLRSCTMSQNQQNRSKPSTNTTGYKGISFRYDGRNRPWCMRIMTNDQTTSKYFKTLFAAAWERNRLAIEQHKDFAYLNDLTKDPSFIGPTLP